MAIIYSYPEKLTPAGGDFLVITDSEQTAPNKNRTKSLTIDNLAAYVVTSTSGVTGGGTLSTIAMFTPDGQKIGDSFIKQQVIAATNLVRIDGGGGFLNKFQSDEIQTSSLLTDNITSEGTGNVILKGGVIIGDQPTDLLLVNSETTFSNSTQFQGTILDVTSGAGTSGQVLTSTGTGVIWANNASSDTTYDLTGQVSNITDFAIGLLGSDGTLDKVFLKPGSNITLTDDGSNGVTIASKYTSYVVKIFQAGTADPVLTEFENSTPFTFTATRTGVGTFDIIPSSSFVDPDKVYVQYGGSSTSIPSILIVKNVNTSEVRVESVDLTTATTVDNFGPAYLELRIYP